MEDVLVSVIIVNWNGRQYLEKCLTSIITQTYKNIEVILVDNNSTDGSREFIAERFPEVILIRNNRNYGFAEANNIGIKAGRGEYVATINNDTEAEPGWIENLVNVIKRDPDIGMCASKILLLNNKDLIDSAGMVLYPDGLGVCRGYLEKDADSYNREEEVCFPKACAALYRKDAVVNAGYFDKDYFAYSEDGDLGLRIRMLGYKCIYVPTARVYHHHSGTFNRDLLLKAYLCERNRLFTIVKCSSFIDLIASFHYTFVRYVYYAYGYIGKLGQAKQFCETKRHRFQIVFILFRIYGSFILNIAKLLRKRHAIACCRKLKYKKIHKLNPSFKINANELVLKGRIYAQ